jgi:hypothetical protein
MQIRLEILPLFLIYPDTIVHLNGPRKISSVPALLGLALDCLLYAMANLFAVQQLSYWLASSDQNTRGLLALYQASEQR